MKPIAHKSEKPERATSLVVLLILNRNGRWDISLSCQLCGPSCGKKPSSRIITSLCEAPSENYISPRQEDQLRHERNKRAKESYLYRHCSQGAARDIGDLEGRKQTHVPPTKMLLRRTIKIYGICTAKTALQDQPKHATNPPLQRERVESSSCICSYSSGRAKTKTPGLYVTMFLCVAWLLSRSLSSLLYSAQYSCAHKKTLYKYMQN